MSRPSSNISSSLSKKRRKSFLRKLILLGFFILCLIVTCIFLIRLDSLKIKTITVTGNTTISQDEITNTIQSELNTKYLWLIPTDNFFLLRRNSIEKQITSTIAPIQSIQLSFNGFHNLQISVSERQTVSIWCDGTPALFQTCYTMDSSGFLFATTTSVLSTTTPAYFGLITNTNPIGQVFFPEHFSDISVFFNKLVSMNLSPVSFYATSESEYQINLASGGRILLNNEKTFDQDTADLQAVIDNSYLKTDVVSLKKINYIDARYGDKVILDFN